MWTINLSTQVLLSNMRYESYKPFIVNCLYDMCFGSIRNIKVFSQRDKYLVIERVTIYVFL